MLYSAKLKKLQVDHTKWQCRNFGDVDSPDIPWLGMDEEVGELSRRILKGHQKIRGSIETHMLGALDAIGDTMIYATSYMTEKNIRLEDVYDFYCAIAMEPKGLEFEEKLDLTQLEHLGTISLELLSSIAKDIKSIRASMGHHEYGRGADMLAYDFFVLNQIMSKLFPPTLNEKEFSVFDILISVFYTIVAKRDWIANSDNGTTE